MEIGQQVKMRENEQGEPPFAMANIVGRVVDIDKYVDGWVGVKFTGDLGRVRTIPMCNLVMVEPILYNPDSLEGIQAEADVVRDIVLEMFGEDSPTIKEQ